MAVDTVKTMLKRLSRSFLDAVLDHVEPVFNDAATGGSSGDGGGVQWHGWAAIGLPGAKFHAMTGQAENTNLVRQARAAGKGFSAQVLERPDYYGAFEQYNSLKIN